MLPIIFTFVLHATRVAAQYGYGPTEWTASPFNPSSLPLAVKSPYVNAWAPLGNGSVPVSNAWPRTWDPGLSTLGWFAAVRVDGTAYSLLGLSDSIQTFATQKSFTFTPTRSMYIMQAGPVNVNMTFLSPVEPSDLVRQSMPFSYMYITTESNDGNGHDVQVYSDISGEWITGVATLDSSWAINESSDFVYLQMQLTSTLPYQEDGSRALDATLYYAMNKTDHVSWRIGSSDDSRKLFMNGTGLDDYAEAGHHGIGIPYYNTLGFAHNFGSVSAATEEVVVALGLVRDPVVQYANSQAQTEERSAYYWSKFTNIHDVISDVLNQFDDAESAAKDLDEDLQNTAGQISSDYANLLALATRQAFGGLEYTLLKSDGEFNTSDVKVFMKDMGGVGTGGVSAVDVMYAAMPAYLYFNPEILGYLLTPHMEYQEGTQYTNQYAAQDLGFAFPNATGNSREHDQKIEETANMIIMSLAHAQASGNGNILTQHYDLLRNWADYLVNNTMSPSDQITSRTDAINPSGQTQTNLVLKGIIGIRAMAKIAEYMNQSDDQSRFDDNATSYIEQWTNLATASDQLVLFFGGSSSGLIYNLYADKLLQLNLLNSSTYDLQTSFYKAQLALWEYGIPMDISNSSSQTRSDWMLFAASSVTDSSVRDSMITQVHRYVSANMQNMPFPVLYRSSNASQVSGGNSPAQGAMFAPLALNLPIQTVVFNRTAGGTSNNDGGSGDRLKVGETVGVAVGSILFFILALCGLVICCRCRRQPFKERLMRVRPATFPSHSAIHPLSATLHPDSVDHQGAGSPTFNDKMIAQHAAVVPFHVRNLTDSVMPSINSEFGSTTFMTRNASSGYSSSVDTQISDSSRAPRKKAERHDQLRSEVDNLRLEIERMREERGALDVPPPAYHEERDLARVVRGQRPR